MLLKLKKNHMSFEKNNNNNNSEITENFLYLLNMLLMFLHFLASLASVLCSALFSCHFLNKFEVAFAQIIQQPNNL